MVAITMYPHPDDIREDPKWYEAWVATLYNEKEEKRCIKKRSGECG